MTGYRSPGRQPIDQRLDAWMACRWLDLPVTAWSQDLQKQRCRPTRRRRCFSKSDAL